MINEKALAFKGNPREIHHFDYVFDEMITTLSLYQRQMSPMVETALKGFNVTIMAYGQTCSGKTHTISGCPESPGIIELCAH